MNAVDIAMQRSLIKNRRKTFVAGNAGSFRGLALFEPPDKRRLPVKGPAHGNKISGIFLDKGFNL